MTNEQLMDQGNRMMDDTDQAIERGKRVGLYLEFNLL
jgi:SNARE protein